MSDTAHNEHWLERMQALDENRLHQLAPLVEASDAIETMRTVAGICRELADPGKALSARFSQPRDDFVRYAFMLRTVAAFLDEGTTPLTLDAWCRHIVHQTAMVDDDFATRLVHWCEEMIDCFGARDVMEPSRTGRAMNHGDQGRVLEFILAALRITTEIPRPWTEGEDVDFPLRVLDVDDVEERYQALSDDERARMIDLRQAFQNVMQQQRAVYAETLHLCQRLVQALPSDISPADDELIKGLAVQDELKALIGDMPLEASALLLEVARGLQRSDQPSANAQE